VAGRAGFGYVSASAENQPTGGPVFNGQRIATESISPGRSLHSGAVWIVVCAMTALVACGDPDAQEPNDKDDAGVVKDAGADTGGADDAVVDAGKPGIQRWQTYSPDHGEKLRSIAKVAGKPGHYVVVGDAGTVVRLEGDKWVDLTPDNIGKADLSGVYVDSKGRVVVAGDKSALAIRDKDSWLVAGEVPPAPAVQFLDVDGVDETYWAVGIAGAAWRHEKGAWMAEAVTVTEGEGIGKGAQFVAVAVTKSDVWIACDIGAKSAGLALQKTAKGWKSYPLATAPRDIWAAGDGGTGVYVVGGTASEFVARFDGKAFVAETGVKWKQGFGAVDGLSKDDVWASAFKGQLRRRDAKGWQVLTIAAPPGTPNPFPSPTHDLVGVAVENADELAVISQFRLYRFGKQ